MFYQTCSVVILSLRRSPPASRTGNHQASLATELCISVNPLHLLLELDILGCAEPLRISRQVYDRRGVRINAYDRADLHLDDLVLDRLE
jgi:hypothetical protein